DATGHSSAVARFPYVLAVAYDTGAVLVCCRGRTTGDEPMALRLPHNVQYALRYALWPQPTGLGSRMASDSIDHRGAFPDAPRVLLCHGLRCESYEREQQ